MLYSDSRSFDYNTLEEQINMSLKNFLFTGLIGTIISSVFSTTSVSAEEMIKETNTDDKQETKVKVENGDTLWDFSQEYDVKLDDIISKNNLKSKDDLIKAGDKLIIPGIKTQEARNKQTQAVTTQVQQPVQQQATTQAPQPVANTQTTATRQAGSFKVTFYDPAVLGATTMPGGTYSGVAASLDVFPKGTQLKITLADGTVMYRTVNDTGTFAYTNPYQLDIAMPNSMVPSYGVTTASVEVIG